MVVCLSPAISHEGSQHHEERGSRCVEVRDESVDDSHVVSRPYEQARRTVELLEHATDRRCAFERSYDGGSHGHDATSCSSCRFDCSNRVTPDVDPLGVNPMPFDQLARHRSERVEAYLEFDFSDPDTAIGESIEQVTREVERSRRGRRGADGLREDRLVPVGILELTLEVRWQRDRPCVLDRGLDVSTSIEGNGCNPFDWIREQGHRESGALDDGARLDLSRRSQECTPAALIDSLREQDLRSASTGEASPNEAGSTHLRPVHDEEISASENLGQLFEPAVLEAVEHEQSCFVTWLDRDLGNGLLRQRVVEHIGTHGPRVRSDEASLIPYRAGVDSEMDVGTLCCDTSTRCALQIPLEDQEGFVGVLDGLGIFADGDRER